MRAPWNLSMTEFPLMPLTVRRLNSRLMADVTLRDRMTHGRRGSKGTRSTGTQSSSFLEWQIAFLMDEKITLPFRQWEGDEGGMSLNIYAPEQGVMFWPGNKRVKKSGRWIRLTMAPHVSIELTEGMIFFAKERPDDRHGFDNNHCYSVVIDVPDFGSLRLWPYEYETVTTRSLIEDLLDGATEFVPGPEAAALYSDQLFYIMSRGIPRETALPMALSSFIDRKRGRSKVPGYFRPTPLVMGVYAYDEMVAKLADAEEAAADEQAVANAAVKKGKRERRLLRFEKTRIKAGKAFFGGRI